MSYLESKGNGPLHGVFINLSEFWKHSKIVSVLLCCTLWLFQKIQALSMPFICKTESSRGLVTNMFSMREALNLNFYLCFFRKGRRKTSSGSGLQVTVWKGNIRNISITPLYDLSSKIDTLCQLISCKSIVTWSPAPKGSHAVLVKVLIGSVFIRLCFDWPLWLLVFSFFAGRFYCLSEVNANCHNWIGTQNGFFFSTHRQTNACLWHDCSMRLKNYGGELKNWKLNLRLKWRFDSRFSFCVLFSWLPSLPSIVESGCTVSSALLQAYTDYKW